MGLYANQKLQLGDETVKGTAVAASTIWRGHGMLEDARTQIMIPEQVGIAVPTARQATAYLLGKLAMSATPATFQQLPYLLEAGIILETPAADGIGTDFIYEYPMGKTSVNTIRSYTIEGGDDADVDEMEHAIVESFTLSGKYGELVQMSANWFGRQLTQAAFTGSLSVPSVEEVVAANGTIYIDEPGGTLGATAVAAGNILDFNLAVNTGRVPRSTIDSGNLFFFEDIFDRESFSGKLSITWRHKAASVTEKGKWQAGTNRQIRLQFTGSDFGTAGTTYSVHTLLIDLVGSYTKFSALENDGGDSVIKAEFDIGYDETADITPLQITVANELASLP